MTFPQPELLHWPKIVHGPPYLFYPSLLPLLSLFVAPLPSPFLVLLLSPFATSLPLAFSSPLSAVVSAVAVVVGGLGPNAGVDGEIAGSSLAE